MISRLLQVLQAENISRSQFAEMLEISPATVTHLLNGRNKPSYEIIQAICKNFPNLNADWLITGNGKMYKNSPNSPENPQERGIFDTDTDSNTLDTIHQNTDTKVVYKTKKIEKILIFYDDGTFQDIPVK
ncbi:MAG: helix-turn-helix domain-containing protein [Candidatus Cryptobacteroides sp.]